MTSSDARLECALPDQKQESCGEGGERDGVGRAARTSQATVGTAQSIVASTTASFRGPELAGDAEARQPGHREREERDDLTSASLWKGRTNAARTRSAV